MEFNQSNNVIYSALEWSKQGIGSAIATVVDTWGSAPRPVGSQLAISGEGGMVGSVSGGCVEGAVILEAIESLKDRLPRILEYGVSDEEAFSVGLGCGGSIRILVEPIGHFLAHKTLELLLRKIEAREAVAYVVNVENWSNCLVEADKKYKQRFDNDQSGFDGLEFITIHNPPLRIAIIGGVHIAQALAKIARISGFDVLLIDPRESFANSLRFPDVEISHLWPDKAIEIFEPDQRTAIVTLTHDPKIDDPAIIQGLKSPCFYIGCLGSSGTHAKRVQRLQNADFSNDEISRINGPVGLKISAKSPSEIAVSIMAQIIQTVRKKI